jgi:hypothetical protein
VLGGICRSKRGRTKPEIAKGIPMKRQSSVEIECTRGPGAMHTLTPGTTNQFSSTRHQVRSQGIGKISVIQNNLCEESSIDLPSFINEDHDARKTYYASLAALNQPKLE